MKRDMDLVRIILLEIEKQYRSTAIHNLTIEGYDMATVAYHCKILHEAGFIADYNAQYFDDDIGFFAVGPLTWDGNDYLDKVRDNSVWNKTKDVGEDVWMATKDGTTKAWNKTKELSGEAWTVTKEGSTKVWHKTKEIGSDAWDITKEAAEDVHHAVMGDDECCCGGCRHHHKAEHNESKTLH